MLCFELYNGMVACFIMVSLHFGSVLSRSLQAGFFKHGRMQSRESLPSSNPFGFSATNHGPANSVAPTLSTPLCRCVQRAAARLHPSELMEIAPGWLLPGLFAAFQHPRPDVRKVVVFCLVDMWTNVGER